MIFRLIGTAKNIDTTIAELCYTEHSFGSDLIRGRNIIVRMLREVVVESLGSTPVPVSPANNTKGIAINLS